MARKWPAAEVPKQEAWPVLRKDCVCHVRTFQDVRCESGLGLIDLL